MFAASLAVEREGWREYVNSLEIGARYPGIRSLGFIRSTRYAVAGWMPGFGCCCRGRVRSW